MDYHEITRPRTRAQEKKLIEDIRRNKQKLRQQKGFQRKGNLIRPNDIVVNHILGKVKLEQDFQKLEIDEETGNIVEPNCSTSSGVQVTSTGNSGEQEEPENDKIVFVKEEYDVNSDGESEKIIESPALSLLTDVGKGDQEPDADIGDKKKIGVNRLQTETPKSASASLRRKTGGNNVIQTNIKYPTEETGNGKAKKKIKGGIEAKTANGNIDKSDESKLTVDAVMDQSQPNGALSHTTRTKNLEDENPVSFTLQGEKKGNGYQLLKKRGKNSPQAVVKEISRPPQPSKNYDCIFCGYQAPEYNTLENHLRLEKHLNERPFQCSLCSKSFPAKGHLNAHIKYVHQKIRLEECDICGHTFYGTYQLKTHIRAVHTRNRRHSCSQCKKSFTHKIYLNRHYRRVHDDNLGFSCDQCNKVYRRKCSLTEHINIVHKNLRKFSCEICDKRFIENRSLRDHVKSKHELIPVVRVPRYSCLFCENKTFVKRSHFYHHLLVHIGERLHGCDICNKKNYIVVSDLSRHKKTCSGL